MTNYRIFNAKEVVSNSGPGSGSLDRAWGVMRNSAVCSGSITLEGYPTADNSFTASHTTIKLEYLPVNTIIPCYVRNITVTTGSAYLLA